MFGLISRLIRHGSGEPAPHPMFRAKEAAATAVEYSPLLALTAAALLATVVLLARGLLPVFLATINGL